MLDALMGPSRDLKKSEKPNDEFKDKNCCKHYLVGCCPNALLGKKMEAIRQSPATYCICPGVVFEKPSVLSPEGCTKLHSQGLRTQLADHPEHAKYRREYEEDLLKFVKKVVLEADDKFSHENRKREALGNRPDNEKLCEVCGLKYKTKRMEYGIEVEDRHGDTDVHKAYMKLREKLSQLKEKQKEWEAEDAKLEEEKKAAAEKKSSEKGRKDGEGRDRSRSREGRRDRSRSREGRKDREGRKTSPEKGEKTEKEEKKDDDKKDKDKSGEKRDRSRSRDRGAGRRDRSEKKSRRRSESRGRNRSRGDRRDHGRGRRGDSRDSDRRDRGGRDRDRGGRGERRSDRGR